MSRKKPSQDALDALLDGLEHEQTDGNDLESEIDDILPPDGLCTDDLGATGATDEDDVEDLTSVAPLGLMASNRVVHDTTSSPLGSDTQVVRRSVNQTHDDNPAVAIMSMLNKIHVEFEAVSTNVLTGWESDRRQIQTVITSLISAIGDNPNTAERHVVEGLVKLLDTKVHSGMLAVKLLEVKTKLLMALKASSNIVINNQNVAAGGQNAELTTLLSSPEESDFDN